MNVAVRAVGHPFAILYRWDKEAQSKSRRPKTTRKTTWTTRLVQAVEQLRLDESMWGRAKIVVKLREQGFKVSEATIGPILAHLVKRGIIEPVPSIRKALKTRKWTAKRRFAERLPKHLKPAEPGQIGKLDTVYVTLAPGTARYEFSAVYDSPHRLDELNSLMMPSRLAPPPGGPTLLLAENPAQYLHAHQAQKASSSVPICRDPGHAIAKAGRST